MHYPVPIHLQGAYADAGYRQGDFPVTEGMMEEVLSLPMYAELGYSSIERIAEVIMSTPGVKRAPLPLSVTGYASPGTVYGIR
jgi:dTDP-4-amino-4,6-dideoxygalactose transaminase